MDAGRCGEQLVLGDQRGRRVLDEHIAGIQPGMSGQEGRKIGEKAGQHAEQSPLRNTAELADAHGGGIEGQGQRLAVEVAAGKDGLVVSEDQRIVGARVQLDRQHPPKVIDRGGGRAVHLGGAAQRIRVLHPVAEDVDSLRCAAQVHGAAAASIDYLRRVLAIELNAGTDNPLVFADDEAVLSGGNFHGEPLALALDAATMGVSELGSISERRLFRMLTGFLSDLPPFLTRHSGLDSGYMLVQYTAAALVTENQLLAVPASVHSLPTSADQEDHNSMGWHSALRARQVATNVESILAMEALGAAQGIDLLAPLKPGRLTGQAHAAIRERVPMLDHDRILYREMETAIELVSSGTLARIAATASPLVPA